MADKPRAACANQFGACVMEKYLRTKFYDMEDMLSDPYTHKFGASWNIIRSPDMQINGSFKFSTAIRSKQSLLYNKSNVNLKVSFDSDRIYKAYCDLNSFHSQNITPSLRIVLNHLTNTYTHIFSVAYSEKDNTVAFGLKNGEIAAYYIHNWKNFGGAAQLLIPLDKFMHSRFQFACWWSTQTKKILLEMHEKDEFSASCYYKINNSKEVTGKITAKENDIQMLLGFKYNLHDTQSLNIRLKSEGFIGLTLTSVLSKWAHMHVSSEISVKELAKSNNTFLGFGIHFYFNNYD